MAFSLVAMGGTAYAQDTSAAATQNDTVDSRLRPEFDPLGLRLGGFLLYPALGEALGFNDNVNSTPGNRRSDGFNSLLPSVDLKSNWSQNALNLHADLNNTEYFRTASQDYTDGNLSANGRLDVQHDFTVNGGAGITLEHVPTSAPVGFAQGKPTPYTDTNANLAVNKAFDQLEVGVTGSFDRYAFSNAHTPAGATVLLSQNNFDDEKVGTKVGWDFVPGRQVYGQITYDHEQYDKSVDLTGVNRSNNGWTGVVGAQYDLTGVTFLDVYAGEDYHKYRSAALGSVTSPTYGAKLIWNITRLDTLTGNLARQLNQSVIANSAGYYATVATLEEDHELLRNVILNATAGYEADNYEGIGRNDQYWRAGAGAKYLMNNNISLTGGYNFTERTSNAVGGGYTDNQILVGVNFHL